MKANLQTIIALGLGAITASSAYGQLRLENRQRPQSFGNTFILPLHLYNKANLDSVHFESLTLDTKIAQVLFDTVIHKEEYNNSLGDFIAQENMNYHIGSADFGVVNEGWNSANQPTGEVHITHEDENYDIFNNEDPMIGMYQFSKSYLNTTDENGHFYPPGTPKNQKNDVRLDWYFKFADELQPWEINRNGVVYFTPEASATTTDGETFTAEGNVMALIPRPRIQLVHDPQGVKITYQGTLEQSSDLETWTVVDPQPESPYIFTPDEDHTVFYRTR